MLDFFRDIYLESKGIDCSQAEIERIKKKQEKEKNKIILSSGVKMIIYVCGVLFLLSSFGTLPILVTNGSLFYIIRNIIQMIIDISVLVCITIRKKKTEIIAIVLIIFFIILQYSSLYFDVLGIR